MNIRLQKYKKNRIAGMNKYNAARAAGFSHNYSRQCKPEKVAKTSIIDAFEQHGLTDKRIIEFALAGMSATKPVLCENDEGFPDWAIRHKFLQTVLELTKRINHQDGNSDGINTRIVVINYPQGYKPELPVGSNVKALPSRIPQIN